MPPSQKRAAMGKTYLEETLGVKMNRLRGIVHGRTRTLPIEDYKKIAEVVGVNSEIEPDAVGGDYVSRLLSFHFDAKGATMKQATETLIGELAGTDENVARRLREGKRHSVGCTVRDTLTGRKGLTPYALLLAYEDRVMGLLGVDGRVPRERLREAFQGDIESLGIRLDGLAAEAKKKNPKPYRFADNSTPYEYHAGDVIGHEQFGTGEVIGEEPPSSGIYGERTYVITVKFGSGEKKLLVNKI